jgi:hypothetical protein
MDEQKNETLIDTDAIGVEVSWSFGGGTADAVKVPRGRVNEALCQRGFDSLPDKDESDALKHAARISRPGRAHIVRELARPNKDTPIAIGVYRVDEVEGEGGDEVGCGARVRFENGSAVCLAPEGKLADPGCMDIGQRIAVTANELAHTAYNKDLSDHLLSVGYRLNWISRRQNKGGVYFLLARQNTVESARAERFVALLRDLSNISRATRNSERFNCEAIEVYPKPLANETITGAAKSSFQAEVDRLAKELDRMLTAGNMRESTAGKRADECDEIIQRAEQYREWLKESTDVLAGRLTTIRDRFRSAFDKAAEGAQQELAAIDQIESKPVETAPLPEKRGRKPVGSEWTEKKFDLSFFDVE